MTVTSSVWNSGVRVAIVVMRAMPQSRVKAALFDRGLLERKPAIVALVGLFVIAALLFWVWRFEGYI